MLPGIRRRCGAAVQPPQTHARAASAPPITDATALVDWARTARPGEAVVYGRGTALSRPVAAVAAKLQDLGLVNLTRRREGKGWAFVVQRCSAPYPRSVGRRRITGYSTLSPETVILRMIRAAIRQGQPCPTNAAFADAAGLADRQAASYRLRKLVAAGVIALIDHGPFEHRQAVWVATGAMTARAPL